MNKEENWDVVVRPKADFFKLNLKEVWGYKDLILLFVKRDFVAIYKQTILGPLWYIFQPIISTIAFTFIFGTIAKISTDGMPAPLFYLSGLTIWNFFTSCLVKNASVFISNSSIFGKVYFPRLTVPIANVLSNFISFSIQFCILICFIIYFKLTGENFTIRYEYLFLLIPLLILIAILGLGIGIILSAITTKYRDFSFLIGFGVQLLMYCSPVIFPLNVVSEKFKLVILLNPATSYIELFRYILTGHGTIIPLGMIYSLGFTFFVLFIGIVLFNRVERSFMDTV